MQGKCLIKKLGVLWCNLIFYLKVKPNYSILFYYNPIKIACGLFLLHFFFLNQTWFLKSMLVKNNSFYAKLKQWLITYVLAFWQACQFNDGSSCSFESLHFCFWLVSRRRTGCVVLVDCTGCLHRGEGISLGGVSMHSTDWPFSNLLRTILVLHCCRKISYFSVTTWCMCGICITAYMQINK